MSKSKPKYYAVACGQKPGIYDKWHGEDGAEAQVRGFPKARFQAFSTIREAREWLKEFPLPDLVMPPEPKTKTTGKKSASHLRRLGQS